MTPLVEITKLGFANGNRVFAKCENTSALSHSHYDRIYRLLFDRLNDDIHQQPDKHHFIETSSGNAGTSFARFCELYGYNGTIIFPKEVRQERLASINGSRVNVLVSDKDGYMRGTLPVLTAEKRSIKRRGLEPVYLNHSQSWQSARAMEPCGLEIALQLADEGLRPDIFISALGNGSSMSGIGLGLRTRNPEVKIVGFEPEKAPVISDLIAGNRVSRSSYNTSNLTGTGVYGINFPNFKLHLLSEIMLISEYGSKQDKWSNYIEQVRDQFEHSIGLTSAAAIYVAKQLAKLNKEKNLIVIFYDISEFYGV